MSVQDLGASSPFSDDLFLCSITNPLFLKHRFPIPTVLAAAIKQRNTDSKNIASPSENPASATFG